MEFSKKYCYFTQHDSKNQPIKWYRYAWCLLLSIFIGGVCVFLFPSGFANNILETILNVVAILTGFLVTALIYAIDNLYNPRNPLKYLFDIELRKESQEPKKSKLFIEENSQPSVNDAMVRDKLLFYSNKSIYMIGLNIIMAIVLLVLIVIYMLWGDASIVNIHDYQIAPISWPSLRIAIKLWGIILIRLLVITLLLYVLIDIVRILCILIQFSDIKHDTQELIRQYNKNE